MDAGTLTLLLQANAKGLTKTLGDADKLTADFAKKSAASAGKMQSYVGAAMHELGSGRPGQIGREVGSGQQHHPAEYGGHW